MKKPGVYKLGMHYRTLVLAIVPALFISFGFSHVASAQVSNLFANPSVETANGTLPADWSSDKWGTTQATFSYPTGGAQDGTRYVQTQVTTKGTGDAKWYPQHIAATPGQTLTFSDYYQSSVQSFVEVEYKLTNGSYKYVRLATLAASASWKQYQKSFTVPANAQTLTIFHFIQAAGTLSVDNYVLTDGSTTPSPPPPTPFTYSLSNTGNKSVAQGNSVTNVVTATLGTGSTQAVAFAATELPSGVTASFSQSSCSPTCSTTLTLSASNSAAVGTSLITVSGTAGTTTKTTTFNLTVEATTPPPPPPSGDNLFANPSVETANGTLPADWSSDKWGTTQATFSYPTGGAQDGTRYVQTQVTTKGTGDAKWYPQHIAAVGGTTYTFSDYYQSSVESYVEVEYKMTTGSYQYVRIATLPASASWAEVQKTFTAPSGVASLTIFHFIQAAGTLSVDNYVLTDGSTTPPPPPPPATNLVQNPSVETENSAAPQHWSKDNWGTHAATFTYVKNAGHTGTHSVKVQITSYTSGDAKWVPAILPVSPGESYRVTDWYMADVENYPVIDFTLTDNTHYYLGLRPQDPAANWTQFSETFSVPTNAKSMQVMHLIQQVGSLSLDDMSVTKITPQGFSRPIVTITFDDGWEDNTTSAIPVLKSHGFKASYFFATQFLESSPATGPVTTSGPQAVKYIQNEGHEIGSHSVTHPDLTTLNDTNLNYELTHSKQYLESLAGAGAVKNLAAPFGNYSDNVIEKSKPLYNSLRSTDEGYNTVENFDAYRLKVQNMGTQISQAQFQSWLDQTKKDKSWLVLVYHVVATTTGAGNSDGEGGDTDTTLANFKLQMAALQNSGIDVRTTDQALQEILPQI